MEAILELCRNKRITFLENDNSLYDGTEKLARLFFNNSIEFNCIFQVEKKGTIQVLQECQKTDVIIYQTTWLRQVSRELKKAFLSMTDVQSKKIFIEVYKVEPTFDSKPENVIHDLYILKANRTTDWIFQKLREDKSYWEI